MKNSIVTILISAFMIFSNLTIAQQASTVWQSFYDGPLHREDYFKHMVLDNEGNVYVLCGTKGDVSGYDQDITTYKVNANGQVVWEKHYNGSGSNSLDDPRDIVYDPNGAVICMGRLRDDGIVVIKYDLAGNTQWTYTAPSTADDVYSICVDNSGNIFLGGKSRVPSSGNYNTLLTKLSPGGSEIFRLFSVYGGTSSKWYSEILKIIPDGADNILAVGNCMTTNGNYRSSFVVKFNSSGSESWKYAHLTDSVYVGSFELGNICVDNTGYVYAAGYNSQGDNNYNDALVMKLSLSSGSVSWIKKVDAGNTGFDHIKSIHTDEQGGIYLFTYSRFLAANASTVLSKMSASNGDVLWSKEITGFGQTANGIYATNDIMVESNGDFYIAKPHIIYNLTKYNPDGDTMWNTYLQGSFIGTVGPSSWMDKYFTTLLKGPDGKIYVGCTGTSVITSLDTTDVMVSCITESPTSVNDDNKPIPREFVLKQNYPNPFNPATKIEFQIADRGFVTLKVYDVLGNEVTTLVNEEKHVGNYEVEFNAKNLSSGIYFYKLSVSAWPSQDGQSENFSQTKKMLLLK